MSTEADVEKALEKAVKAPELVEVKKKPGRPKKKVSTVPMSVQGVVETPSNDEDVVELVYDNPMLFKKLVALYKSFEVSQIELNFDPVGVKIVTKDHLNKSTIYTSLSGACMNLYYCKEHIKICVKLDNLERVLNSLDKNHYKISIVLKRETYRSKMLLTIKNMEYDCDALYEIDVVFKPETNGRNEIVDDDTNYPLKFKFTAKHFKSMINSTRKLSKTFTIQKCGNGPVQFTFDKATETKVNWTGIYGNSNKLELKSNLHEDESFNASIFIDHIKPFSNASIGDDVYISVDKREKMSFMTTLDKKDHGFTAVVKVFTELKDYRPAGN
jgi:hypothetical protein